MTDLSCADFTFPLLDRRRCLALLRMLEFPCVDIGLFARSDTFSPSALCATPAAYTRAVREDLERENLRAADVFLQIGADPPEAAANDPSSAVRSKNRDVFRTAVDFAAALECRHLTGLPGVYHEHTARQADWELAVEEALWRNGVCSSAGIEYAVEPHLGSICNGIESTLRFVAAAPGLTLTLDYGHFIFNGVPSEQVHSLARHASHFHARAGARGRLQAPLSENEIDFKGAIAALSEAAFRGNIALEYVWIEWNQCNRCDNISETILLREQLAQFLLDPRATSVEQVKKRED
jgi:sugar phosphate isomerase/epimerase